MGESKLHLLLLLFVCQFQLPVFFFFFFFPIRSFSLLQLLRIKQIVCRQRSQSTITNRESCFIRPVVLLVAVVSVADISI